MTKLANFNSPASVKRKLQASLYNNRKKRKAIIKAQEA